VKQGVLRTRYVREKAEKERLSADIQRSEAESKAKLVRNGGKQMKEKFEATAECWKSVRGFVLFSLVYRKFF